MGGLAHVLLPEPALARDQHNTAKFAATAVPMLMEELAAMGARARRLEARLAGGASMFATLMVPGSLNMGERNIRASREALRRRGGCPSWARRWGATTGARCASPWARGARW